MEIQTVYFTGMSMMVSILISQMYNIISVLRPVLLQVLEYLSPSASTSISIVGLELMSTSKVQVPEIQYSSTANRSTEYEYPIPDNRSGLGFPSIF